MYYHYSLIAISPQHLKKPASMTKVLDYAGESEVIAYCLPGNPQEISSTKKINIILLYLD